MVIKVSCLTAWSYTLILIMFHSIKLRYSDIFRYYFFSSELREAPNSTPHMDRNREVTCRLAKLRPCHHRIETHSLTFSHHACFFSTSILTFKNKNVFCVLMTKLICFLGITQIHFSHIPHFIPVT